MQKLNQKKEHNEYYTPNIKEFYVGFEFEVFTEDLWYGNKTGNYSWKKHVYSEAVYKTNNPWVVEELLPVFIRDKKVRVKFLDKFDIESLGLEYHLCDHQSVRGSSRWCVSHHKESKTLYIEYIINGVVKSKLENIYCKNKSELKKIMEQVGYKF